MEGVLILLPGHAAVPTKFSVAAVAAAKSFISAEVTAFSFKISGASVSTRSVVSVKIAHSALINE